MRRITVREHRREDPFTVHQVAIARKTMRMSCIGARIMGGMDHARAAEMLNMPIPRDCTCGKVESGRS